MKKYLIIFFSFLAAFIISQFSIDNLFLAKSPHLNPFFLSNLKNNLDSTKNRIASLFQFGIFNTASVPANMFKPITKGVSAYEKSSDERYFKVDKGTKYKIRQIKLKDGTVLNAIDFTGN